VEEVPTNVNRGIVEEYCAVVGEGDIEEEEVFEEILIIERTDDEEIVTEESDKLNVSQQLLVGTIEMPPNIMVIIIIIDTIKPHMLFSID
jgi:hypothetical protein